MRWVMGEVTKIRVERPVAPVDEQKAVKQDDVKQDDRNPCFYGQTAFQNSTGDTHTVSRSVEKGNSLLLMKSGELNRKEGEGIDKDLGMVSAAIKELAPTSSNVGELRDRVRRHVNSTLVRAALDEFKKQMHRA